MAWTALGDRERREIIPEPELEPERELEREPEVEAEGVAQITPCVAEPAAFMSQPAGHVKLPLGARQR